MQTEQRGALLLLGLGNLLMGDEGLGVHLARRLEERSDLPPGVQVQEGGTAGFQLTEYFTGYPVVILIDATLDANPPGTIRLLKPRFSSEFPNALSTHDIGLKDLLDGLTLLGCMPEIHLFAMSVNTLQPMHIGLSPEVEAALPELERRVIELANELTTVNRL
ncbi:MAG: hydrogenase maturation protease [Saprospiraceae bacterium]|nr:hydrogenase maturation protease [Saprospiraceae bacterium]